MGKYYDMLLEDVRMREGLHACMNCGVCTGVCPAAEFPIHVPFFCWKSFVYSPSLKVYLEMFLKMYWELVRLQEAHLLE